MLVPTNQVVPFNEESRQEHQSVGPMGSYTLSETVQRSIVVNPIAQDVVEECSQLMMERDRALNNRLLNNEMIATEWIQGLHNGLNTNTKTIQQIGERLNASHLTVTNDLASVKEVLSHSTSRLDLVIE